MITRSTIACLLAISTTALADTKSPDARKPAPAAADDDLPGPQPEVAKETGKVDLPVVPAFELPPVEPGLHGTRELRVHGKELIGSEVKVVGYIVWIYDCQTQLAEHNPDVAPAKLLKAIDKDPSLCERPKFALADTRDTPREASVSIVDVPRPPTRAERGNRKPSELKGWWPDVPKLAIGDYVMVTGTWDLLSPHSEHNTQGLVVYKALEHLATPAAPPVLAPTGPVREPEIEIAARPPRKPVTDAVRNQSVDQLNACNKQIAARQFDAAIAACQAAVKIWPGNHLAWYAWSSAHMARSEWQKARDTVEHAVGLRPDHAMYQLYHGISLYEAEHERVRDEQARAQGKPPEETAVDPKLMKLEAARDALRRAIKVNPSLWRGHYYLGRIYRDVDDFKREAEQFSATIATHPAYRYGYVALIELYRRWSYIDEALAVAQLGTVNIPAAEASDMWFEVGMAYDAKRDTDKANEDKAIDAFGKAIAGKPSDVGSRFQRGQAYFRKGDFANAKPDLAEVVKSSDPTISGVKPLAVQMLGQILKKAH